MGSMQLAAAAGAIVAMTTVVSSAQAELVTLSATRDATIYQSSDGSLANGAGRYVFAGRTNQNLSRRGLIHFDVASASRPEPRSPPHASRSTSRR